MTKSSLRRSSTQNGDLEGQRSRCAPVTSVGKVDEEGNRVTLHVDQRVLRASSGMKCVCVCLCACACVYVCMITFGYSLRV